MTKHFSFSTELIFLSFFFSFLFLFNIFLIHLLFRKKFTGHIVGKKISPGRSDGNKQFFFFGLTFPFSQPDMFSVGEMVVAQKVSQSKYAKLQNSIQLSVENVGNLGSNFTSSECFLKSLSYDILLLCEANLRSQKTLKKKKILKATFC